MVGWWRCCVCNNHNNPALSEGICVICGHMRASCCTTLG
jgi:hypothetical protein